MAIVSSIDPVINFSAGEEVSDKRVEEHVLAWCATKLHESEKLSGTVCKPLESPNNGGTRLVGVIAAEKQGGLVACIRAACRHTLEKHASASSANAAAMHRRSATCGVSQVQPPT